MLAGMGETWVLTRRVFQEAIDDALPSTPERDNLVFVYIDLPEFVLRLRRRKRGPRIDYVLWQVAALREARRIRRSVGFDAVWHLTWATAWFGSLAALAGRPFVYGPVGGCVGTVWRLLPALGVRGASREILRVVAHRAARYANPLARLSWRRADLVLVQNRETRMWLPARHRAKARVFPNTVLREEVTREIVLTVPSGPPTALFAGRIEGFKGVFLCLRALAILPGWRLVVCGEGKDERRLRRLAGKLGVEDRVDWVGSVSQVEVVRRMSEADVLMLPCLHEEAGMVVVEARAAGLPVITLDRGGPPILAGPAGILVEASGSAHSIARELAAAAVTGLRWRRSGVLRGFDADEVTLRGRAEALGELLRETLRLPHGSDPRGGGFARIEEREKTTLREQE